MLVQEWLPNHMKRCRGVDLPYAFVEHSAEHYGQLFVY